MMHGCAFLKGGAGQILGYEGQEKKVFPPVFFWFSFSFLYFFGILFLWFSSVFWWGFS
jgi:hypothetical protein